MGALERKAGLILEAEGVDSFRKLNPYGVVEQSAAGLDGFLRLIPTRGPTDSDLAILIIPELEIVQGTHKIMGEVILDVRDAASERGYQRFIVAARSHGFAVQIYEDGLPSREQVAEKKRSWKLAEEKFRRDDAK
jgi:hypothetical protein